MVGANPKIGHLEALCAGGVTFLLDEDSEVLGAHCEGIFFLQLLHILWLTGKLYWEAVGVYTKLMWWEKHGNGHLEAVFLSDSVTLGSPDFCGSRAL